MTGSFAPIRVFLTGAESSLGNGQTPDLKPPAMVHSAHNRAHRSQIARVDSSDIQLILARRRRSDTNQCGVLPVFEFLKQLNLVVVMSFERHVHATLMLL